MQKIAYISYNDIGKFHSAVENEDPILFKYLTDRGIALDRVIWNDPGVDWSQYKQAILKSPWDYFDYPAVFFEWLEKLKNFKITLLNPIDIVKWNADKHYLKEISDTGLAIIPTIYMEKGMYQDLNTFFDTFNTDQFILKPCISGGSIDTFKVNKDNVQEINKKIQDLIIQKAFMIQPFIKEVAEDGEWSLIFFNGTFSHCVLKKAKSGDFRVQHFLGGSIHPQQPSQELLESCTKYVQNFAKNCLYARVDGVIVNGKFQLMELELIEPFLFLFTNENAYKNYYKGLKEILSDNT